MSSGKPVAAVAAGELAAEDRADGAVDIADRQLERDRLAALERRHAAGTKRRHVERRLEAVLLIAESCGRRRPGPTSGRWKILLKSRPLAL